MSMAYGIIYLATCTTTGLKYVGQTTGDLQRRWRGHCDAAKKGRIWKLSEAIREHGSESFQLKVLCECDSAEALNEIESRLIQELNVVWPNGYNMKNMSGRVMCEEMRQKISQRTREAMSRIDPEIRKQQKERQCAAMNDSDLRQKISQRTQVAMQRPEIQAAMHVSRSNNRTGYKTPEETKRKIREKLQGQVISEETRQKLREAAKRKLPRGPVSEETKQKIRATLKARYA